MSHGLSSSKSFSPDQHVSTKEGPHLKVGSFLFSYAKRYCLPNKGRIDLGGPMLLLLQPPSESAGSERVK